MMKLTTKTRYGLRAMLALALEESGEPLSIKLIAQQQDIPEAYLEQLMATLKKEGLVVAVRGAQGGYILGTDSAEISVGQIIRALEGSLALVNCVEDEEFCVKSDQCAMHLLWARIHQGIDQIVDGITLGDMVNDHHMLNQTEKGRLS